MDEQSSEAKKKLFAALAQCNCCTRHQTDKPLTYEHDPELDARTMSKAQEIALHTLSAEDYIEWRNADRLRKNKALFQCNCHCRIRMRSMVRHIPPPSPYDWTSK